MKTLKLSILLVLAAALAIAQTAQPELPPLTPVKVCQLDDNNAPMAGSCFVIPVPVLSSFRAFIAEQVTKSTNAQGVETTTPKYAGIFDLLVKHFISSLVVPLLDKYPPPELTAMKAQAAAIQAQVDAAKAAVLAGAGAQ